jgi:hypothetical protein
VPGQDRTVVANERCVISLTSVEGATLSQPRDPWLTATARCENEPVKRTRAKTEDGVRVQRSTRKVGRGHRTPEGIQRAAEAAAEANRLEDPELELIRFPLRLQRRLVNRIDAARGAQTRTEYVRRILEEYHDPERNPSATER